MSLPATKSLIPIPEGLSYRDYQVEAIHFCLEHAGALVADDPGLGKTIEVAGVINADDSLREVLIGCPPSLAINWKRELEKWLVRPVSIGIAVGDYFPPTDIVILPYSIAWRHRALTRLWLWDLMVLDEAHACKNPDAYRSRAFLDRWHPVRARRMIFTTGTPIENKPIEIHVLAKALRPKLIQSRHDFGVKFCGAVRVQKGPTWEWEYPGATCLPELHTLLKNFMIRRRKADVLQELPPKTRSVIRLEASKRVAAEAEALHTARENLDGLKKQHSAAEARGLVERMEDLQAKMWYELDSMAAIRHETALIKVELAMPFLLNLKAQLDKLLIFAWHRDVIEALSKAFDGQCVLHHGGMNANQKQKSVDQFQDGNAEVFIGNIASAGVGLTLTAARVVVFVELDWSPKKLEQAEDRAHRMGQTENVLVYYIVLDGSLDAAMASTICRKLNIIDKAIDGSAAHTQASDWAGALLAS